MGKHASGCHANVRAITVLSLFRKPTVNQSKPEMIETLSDSWPWVEQNGSECVYGESVP